MKCERCDAERDVLHVAADSPLEGRQVAVCGKCYDKSHKLMYPDAPPTQTEPIDGAPENHLPENAASEAEKEAS